MRIISESALPNFWLKIPASENAMRDWIKIVRLADWRNFADVRGTFNHADVFGDCTRFDVGGNKYRIIANVEYPKHLVFIRFVLMHSEFDKNRWEADCK